jgi:hypothetical protein
MDERSEVSGFFRRWIICHDLDGLRELICHDGRGLRWLDVFAMASFIGRIWGRWL